MFRVFLQGAAGDEGVGLEGASDVTAGPVTAGSTASGVASTLRRRTSVALSVHSAVSGRFAECCRLRIVSAKARRSACATRLR
jgi:hypothetical protein